MFKDDKKYGFTLVELLVVMGIFTLIVGVSFSFLSTGRFSAQLTEAQLEAAERGQTALSRITRELRLSAPLRVTLSDNVSRVSSLLQGSVVNFQVPVGVYDDTLNLTSMYDVRWGTETVEDSFLAYSVDADDQLIRSTYSTINGSDAVSEVIGQGISSLAFIRTSSSSDLLTVEITSQSEVGSKILSQTVHTRLRFRD